MARKAFPNDKLIFARNKMGICPVCKQPPEDWVYFTFYDRTVKICKKHLGFNTNEKGDTTLSLSIEE